MARGNVYNTHRFTNKSQTQSPREQTTSYGAPQRGPVLTMPTAQVGSPVPYFVGKQRIAQPNVIEYANIRGIEETTYTTKENVEVVREVEVIGTIRRIVEKEIITTTTVATTTTVGYLVDIILALALGPGVRLNGIYSDNEPLWTGDGGDGTTGTITGGDFFLTGTKFTFRSGEFNQTPYVGIAYIVLQDVRADKAYTSLQFDISRYPNPLGLSNAVNRFNDDINVASAITDIVTNGWGGIGADISVIDIPSFTAAAIKLAGESNYCSLLVMDEVRGTDLIKTLQQQTRGTVFQNPSTGKLEFALIRDEEINFSQALSLSDANTTQLRNFTKGGWQDTISQLRATYTDRNADYGVTPVFLQNPANMNQSGRGKRTGTIDYPTVMNSALAIKLGARDLSLVGAPSYSLEAVTNRISADRKPGDIVFVTSKRYKLYGVPMVINKVRKQPITDNSVSLYLSQYRYPSADDIYVAPVSPGPGVTEPLPTKPVGSRIVSAPYFIASRGVADMTSTGTDYGVYPMILPHAADGFQTSFATYITNVPGVTGDVQTNLEAKYANTGQLVAPISIDTGFTSGVIPSVVVNGVTISNIIDTYIANAPSLAKVRAGAIFLMINDEIMSFAGATKTGPTEYTLTNVYRSLLDTVPANHAANDRVYIFTSTPENLPGRQFDFPPTFTPNWRIVSNTATAYGLKADALITNAWSPSFNRTLAPVRPHATAIDGIRNRTGSHEVVAGGTARVSWRTRNRASTVVALYADAFEPGEVDVNADYQIHRVFIRDAGNVVHDCGATANDDTYNFLDITVPAGASVGAATLWVRSETVNGNSFYHDEISLTITPAMAIATEDGNSFIINEAANRYIVTE